MLDRRSARPSRRRSGKGYFLKPTVFVGNNSMRIFQEIFGPMLSVTTFKTVKDAIRIGNDTVYGLGAGVWSRNGTNAYRVGRGIQAGSVWTTCYHAYPAHVLSAGIRNRVSAARPTR
jgi:aldehyde dehydrogenase